MKKTFKTNTPEMQTLYLNKNKMFSLKLSKYNSSTFRGPDFFNKGVAFDIGYYGIAFHIGFNRLLLED
jgi:hypothetical protein